MLPPPVAEAVKEGNLVAAAVLSGNRNFEGRVNPLVKANYLASPPLVVAYALAGSVDIDLATEPLGTGSDVGSAWLLALLAFCLALVAGAVLVRALSGLSRETAGGRLAAVGGLTAFVLALALWLLVKGFPAGAARTGIAHEAG